MVRPAKPLLTRRQLLRLGVALPAGALLPLSLASAQESAAGPDPFGGFRMSIATYSLREFSLDEAVRRIRGYGLSLAEVNPKHVPVDSGPETLEAARRLFDNQDVEPRAFGVFYTERYKADRKGAIAAVFRLAKALGIRTISCDSEQDWLSAMEDEAARTGVRIGIHNHGPGSRYPTLESLEKAVSGRHENVGVTLDTGHLMRSNEDPVAAVRTLGKRMHGCHLKDAKGKETSLVLGTGDLDLLGLLRALREVRFEGALSLEYERNPKDPDADIRQCLLAMREAVKKL
jgi:sugar phosphate isomerase/epimerase